MSFEKAKADLEEKGLGDHVIVLNESSATVAEAAHALGVEPASIAKTLSVLQGEKPVLIVTEGTAKLDNHKYKSLFHMKAKMIPYDEVEAYVGHAPGGVCQKQAQAVNHDQMGGVIPVKQRADIPCAFFAVVQRQKGNAQKSPPLDPAVMQTQQADTDGKQRQFFPFSPAKIHQHRQHHAPQTVIYVKIRVN